jgi:hypothetical protein
LLLNGKPLGRANMKRKFWVLVLMVACKTAGGGREAASTLEPKSLLLRLDRGGCLGSCPAYIVEVDTDGTVRYEGEFHVAMEGTASGRLELTTIATLRAAIDQSEFWNTPGNCCDCRGVTDAPYVSITLADGRPVKTIRDYHGCEATPKRIRDLEDSIDRIIGTERWTGTREER